MIVGDNPATSASVEIWPPQLSSEMLAKKRNAILLTQLGMMLYLSSSCQIQSKSRLAIQSTLETAAKTRPNWQQNNHKQPPMLNSEVERPN